MLVNVVVCHKMVLLVLHHTLHNSQGQRKDLCRKRDKQDVVACKIHPYMDLLSDPQHNCDFLTDFLY